MEIPLNNEKSWKTAEGVHREQPYAVRLASTLPSALSMTSTAPFPMAAPHELYVPPSIPIATCAFAMAFRFRVEKDWNYNGCNLAANTASGALVE